MMALYYGQAPIADALIAHGAPLDIWAAAVRGDTARIAELLASDLRLVHALSADGWTPLHLAAHFGQVAVMRQLLAAGAVVDARSANEMRNTPLHAAAAGTPRTREAAILLVEHGADVNATQHGDWTALHAAAQNGDAELATVLPERGAEVNARHEGGQTALALAEEAGQAEVAALLKRHGGEV
jgi:ankyrin repeat protein